MQYTIGETSLCLNPVLSFNCTQLNIWRRCSLYNCVFTGNITYIIITNAESPKQLLMSFALMRNARKSPYKNFGQCRSRSACASMPSDLCILCSSTYTTVSIGSESGQWRPWSACAYEQADLGLRCPQIALGSFSCVEHHFTNGINKPQCTIWHLR